MTYYIVVACSITSHCILKGCVSSVARSLREKRRAGTNSEAVKSSSKRLCVDSEIIRPLRHHIDRYASNWNIPLTQRVPRRDQDSNNYTPPSPPPPPTTPPSPPGPPSCPSGSGTTSPPTPTATQSAPIGPGPTVDPPRSRTATPSGFGPLPPTLVGVPTP